MNEVPAGEALTHESARDWARLRNMSDDDIHDAVASDPDIIATHEDCWKTNCPGGFASTQAHDHNQT